jgi:drug/metabolite transporter (DMT)-like permease
LLFNEPLPGLWWVGATLIIIGVVFIVRSSQTANSPITEKKKQE